MEELVTLSNEIVTKPRQGYQSICSPELQLPFLPISKLPQPKKQARVELARQYSIVDGMQ